jgi:hypothetical protein
MPRTLSSQLRDWLDLFPMLESHSTMSAFLPYAVVSTTYYFGSQTVQVGFNIYPRSIRNVGEMKLSMGRAADRVEVVLSNAENDTGPLFYQERDISRGSIVQIGRLYYNPSEPGEQEHVVLFTGTVASVTVDENDTRLSIVSDLFAGGQVGATRLVSPSCQFKFKDPETCAYSGAGTVCTKIYDDATGGCEFYANQHHFGGALFQNSQAATQTAAGGATPANQLVQIAGTPVQQRQLLNIIGGATAVDNPTTEATDLNLSGVGRAYAIHAKTDHAAIGDGVADDTTALQAAIDAGETTGRAVYIPAGVYYAPGGLTLTGQVFLFGDSNDKSIVYSDANAPIITTAKDATTFQGPHIADLMIRGDVTAGSDQHGIVCDDSEVIFNMHVHDVIIEKCGGSGLVVKKCFASTFQDIYLSDCAGWPLLYDAANMPVNHFRRVDAGLLRDTAPVGYRIKAGTFIGQNLNSIYNVVLGSKVAVVGRKNGVDGDVTSSPAIAIWENCNFESYTGSAVDHLFGSKSDFRGVCTFAAQASIILDVAGVDASQTTITANSTGGFPSSGKIQMELETISYTSINSTQFLGCTRGVDGTTAATHAQFTIVANKQVKPLVYDVDTVGNYPAFATRGIIEDSCNFNDGPETQYANNQAVHCNDFPPLETAGKGPGVNPGNASPALGTYWNSTTSKIEALARADGSMRRIEVNDDRVFPNPGVRWIEVNNTSGGPIDVTLPPPIWSKTQDVLIIKDVAGNAGTHTISVYGGGGSQIDDAGVFTMEIDYQSAIFVPNEVDTVNGAWRLIATYPPPGYLKTTGGGFAGYFGQYVDDTTLTGGTLYELSSTIISKRAIAAETDNTFDVGSSGGNRFRTFFVGTSVRLPDSSAPSLARNSDITTGIGVNASGIHQSVAGAETFTVTATGATVTGDLTISGATRQITGTGLTANFGANPDVEFSAGGVLGRMQAITGSYLQAGTTSNHPFVVIVNNTGTWSFGASAAIPLTAQSLGGASNRITNYFGNSFLDISEISTPANPAAGTRRIYPKSSGWYELNSAGTETALGGAGGITGSLTAGRVVTSSGTSTVTDSATFTYASGVLTVTGTSNPHLYISDTANTIDVRVGTLAGAPDRGIIGTMTNDPFWLYANGNPAVGVVNIASAVNFLQITPSVSSNPIDLAYVGSATNGDITVTPKGTGVLSTPAAFVDITNTSTSSAFRVCKGLSSTGAIHPGAGGGLLMPLVGGSQSSGPGIWWANNNYNALAGIWLSNGFNFQGHSSSGSPLKIRKGTGTSSDGALVFTLAPDSGVIDLAPFGTSAGNTSSARFFELAANGSNYVALKAPDALAGDITFTLPHAFPAASDRPIVSSSAGVLTASVKTRLDQIIADGVAGSTTTGTGAGTGPSLTIDGNDVAGAILLTTGTLPAANAKILDVTLAASFTNYPVVILTAGNAAAATAISTGSVFVDDAVAAVNKFTLKSGAVGLTASTDYVFYYHVIGF